MNRAERARLRPIVEELSAWVDTAARVADRRREVGAAAASAEATLRARLVEISSGDAIAWRILPLRADDGAFLQALAVDAQLPDLSDDGETVLRRLAREVAPALDLSRSVLGMRRWFTSGGNREAGESAVRFLDDYHRWGTAVEVRLPAALSALATQHADVSATVEPGDPLGATKLGPRLGDLGRDPALVAAGELADLPIAIQVIHQMAAEEEALRKDAVSSGEDVRWAEARELLGEMDVERLSDATRERLRVAPLRSAGFTTVRQVLDHASRLKNLDGIGSTSALRIEGAAQTLWKQTYDDMPVRLDIAKRSAETTELLRRLALWDAVRQAGLSHRIAARADELSPLAEALRIDPTHVVVFSVGNPSVAELRQAAALVIEHADNLTRHAADGRVDPWADFEARPADYFAMLAELGFVTGDDAKAEGDLPEEIVEAIRALQLETDHLRANLRGYQSFGARFALVQKKVIIGDEMGLGKTVEALAVIAHLRAGGSGHALVVCPAAVVTNWIREIGAKTRLAAYRIHGESRAVALKSWQRNGGVAVTTFEMLKWLEPQWNGLPAVECIVVDEAHYVKNPDAQRSRHTTGLIGRSEHAVLLTGTPMENRLDEFRNLVGYLRPDLIVDADELSPKRFRRQVAPAYLRRNQEDVLTELPEKVEVEEWLTMSPADATAYRGAVRAGNFHSMRQAAMLSGRGSSKMDRLVEIVREAEDNGRRVLVFSDYLEVLSQVILRLKQSGATAVFGPLTGSVPAHKRQGMVDAFSAGRHGAVLVSQIRAGGVGLNVQSASVVVICEPQLKPTIEWQAIARAHRMGQLQTVQVHRLLSDDGVDQRLWDVLARKRELFEDFARVSESAASAAEAYDVSEHELVRDVLEAERERLFAVDRPRVAPNLEQSEPAAPSSRSDPISLSAVALTDSSTGRHTVS